MDWITDTLRLHETGARFALALVAHTTGSTPQKAGAAALFTPDGRVRGTLGGGCLEAEAQQRALRALDTGEHALFRLRLDEIDGWDDGLICGGSASIFIEPDINPHLPALRQAADILDRGARGVLHLRFDGAPLQCDEVAPSHAEPRCVQHDGLPTELLMPLLPPPRLVIAGAGHIGKAVARLGAFLGFRVLVIDDRPSLANTDNLPGAHDVICGNIPCEVGKLELGEDDYVVIVTRGHRNDGQVLAACIGSNAAYIGMIGSKRKSLLIQRGLLESGQATEEQLARVQCPIGLDIGAQSVEEIAISIAAELVQARRASLRAFVTA